MNEPGIRQQRNKESAIKTLSEAAGEYRYSVANIIMYEVSMVGAMIGQLVKDRLISRQ